jgi:MFS family permease
MYRSLISVFSLLTGTLFLLVGSGMQSLVMPLRGQAEGFTVGQLGLLGTGWASGFVISCLLSPKLISRVGHVRAFGAFAAIGASVALLSALMIDPIAWFLLRILTGFVMAGAFMVIESWLNDAATNENRGVVFGMYLMVTYAGITLGQLGAAFGSTANTSLFIVTGIFYCLALVPTALSTAASPKLPDEAKMDLGAIWRNSPIAAFGCFLVGIANGCFGTLGAVYASQIGLTSTNVAVMMSAAVLAGAIIQIPVGRFSDKTDRRYVLAAAATGAALVGLAMILFQPRSTSLILVMVAIYGALAYSLYSLAVAHANDFADPSNFVKLSSGLLLLYGAGTIIGPLFGAVAMDRIGPEGLFAVTAISHLAVAGYAMVRSMKRAPIPIGLRRVFRSIPSERAQTPESVRLDPRSEHNPN